MITFLEFIAEARAADKKSDIFGKDDKTTGSGYMVQIMFKPGTTEAEAKEFLSDNKIAETPEFSKSGSVLVATFSDTKIKASTVSELKVMWLVKSIKRFKS